MLEQSCSLVEINRLSSVKNSLTSSSVGNGVMGGKVGTGALSSVGNGVMGGKVGTGALSTEV